ncbi:uncharacterized protein LACBIDRAFT_333902 [Laccaria bicolor S238N-H82]|uniref:Predicted protein n=1 Tax=Laccaria bicolor (strain S238N-H82 / ATCC MYA-4686) TaxID=486041 RepID=B0DXG1_LACBS|nr:uncharacterized protein LACBIDRAFT_333902 [Laccaria bicolor S238N-H82]EDR00670.1 predicted protein [Laccaria bicolor S238N-H82]|eukprot:XP_001888679.1 predicted protein [Laccaria bicolor S238N-H82]
MLTAFESGRNRRSCIRTFANFPLQNPVLMDSYSKVKIPGSNFGAPETISKHRESGWDVLVMVAEESVPGGHIACLLFCVNSLPRSSPAVCLLVHPHTPKITQNGLKISTDDWKLFKEIKDNSKTA